MMLLNLGACRGFGWEGTGFAIRLYRSGCDRIPSSSILNFRYGDCGR
ncbi:hypothetical protein AALP_AA8G274600 [Arabis alpina]|uniref:Uncharacterized protein n=1 Tax=Arabis alpina TaxID=50452 RepID=A0A087G9T8_ARAAL|nr:hypothetical protein AALP_AA8G274600 [Arabis alpina]